ncbi:MAG: 50S ribosomal protein L15 [Cyanobacteria bacterium]|nr:50S ribosomal protein L15 [Cyanobacteriota bacterium]MDA1020944.1 50S ribosomal protein L15 [Cyanobacteriota bacterium]
MAETLKKLRSAKGATKVGERVGRGISSGSGKTSGRGHRGQKCRSGYSRQPWREGGQTPLYRRLPKRQVNTRVNRKEYSEINLADLQIFADNGITDIDVITLVEHGKFKVISKWGVKVLGNGAITTAITVRAEKFSASAKEAIEKAGGKALITVIDEETAA